MPEPAPEDRAIPVPAFELPDDRRLLGVQEAAREALAKPGGFAVVGAAGSGHALLARALLAAGASHVLYIAPDAEAAQRATEDLRAVASLGLPPGMAADEPLPLLLPGSEISPYAEAHPDRRIAMQRAAALFTIARDLPWRTAVVSPGSLLRRVAPAAALAGAALELATDGELDLERTAKALTAAGYLRAPVVEDPASFAVRGGVFDVWPANAERPVRAELFGDLVLSLKLFDPDDQRTSDAIRSVWLPPARETVLGEAAITRARGVLRTLCDDASYPSSKARGLIDDLALGRSFFGSEGYLPAFYELVPLFSYLPPKTALLLEDPPALARAILRELEQAEVAASQRGGVPHFPVEALYVSVAEVEAALGQYAYVAAHRAAIAISSEEQGVLGRLEGAPLDAPTLAQRDHSELGQAMTLARAAHKQHASLEPLVERIAAWRDEGLAVLPVARSATQAERIGLLLRHRGVELEVPVAPLGRGCIAPLERLVLITDEEIFGPRAHRSPPRKRSSRALLEDLRALAPGDYVVHVEHGIGKYVGLERREVGGVGLELIVVEYTGGDKLFLPVYRLNQIQKYSGGDGTPRLDRLGGQTFAKTKASVQRRVRQMADELLRLYAERTALEKTPLPAPDDDYAAFEASFPFEETRDQAAAISEVLGDLQSKKVMDRLVCGDVGFGKTEVALRAAFLMALHGRQVAVLCPTTVLAQQHYQTFSQRFGDWPIRVKALSRFSTKSEAVETVKGLRDGTVDVVIGTHRLLSKDVHYKNLGLLVVDEEQRFGVTHKERIKQIRASVDVLTLSATPIPRTLQLAVGGLRDMSIIATPPVDRRTIRTLTSQFDPTLVREAVEQELARGGQIFYVYNRVEGIHERAERLQALVPGARVAVAHGQLTEELLERTMLGFVEGEYDVLVATAIIESGLDIPRANTIIVDRADMLGLAQLYQLRGRVGRSRERAYCYLLVPPPSQLSDEARARLEALERFSELGSGFHLATLDMELRGAGDVLGAEQSGFAASVGFELFCRMLEEATLELRGEPVVHEVEPELSFDVEALISAEYVAEVGVRLSLYKRFASAADEAEIDELAQELENRFGAPPLETKRFVELMRLKVELRRLRVLGCEASAKSVSLLLRDDTPLDPAKVRELIARKRSPYRLTPDGRLTRRLLETEAAADGLVLASKTLEELLACVG